MTLTTPFLTSLPSSEARYTTLLYQSVLSYVVVKAHTEVEGSESSKASTLSIDCLPSLRILEDSPQRLNANLIAYCAMMECEEVSGIPPEARSALNRKVLAFARKFFGQLPREISPDEVASHELDKRLQLQGYESFRIFRHTHCHYTLITPALTLTPEDCTFLRLSPEAMSPPDAKELDCGGYALLKLREERAIEWILTHCSSEEPHPLSERFYSVEGLKLLVEWEYRPVETPQPGDLVIYLQNPASPEVTHAGIFTAEGRVESKLGTDAPGVEHHTLEDVLGQYGRHVIFFRK